MSGTTPEEIEAEEESAKVEAPVEKPDTRDIWLQAAREFVLSVEGYRLYVTRYNNHRRLIPDGGWVAMVVLGPMNPWYAIWHDGKWELQYKNATTLRTREEAYSAGCQAIRGMIERGEWEKR